MTTPTGAGPVLPETPPVAREAVGPWRATSIVLLSVFLVGGLAVLGWLAIVWVDVTTGPTDGTASGRTPPPAG
jgi:hypothetical protein